MLVCRDAIIKVELISVIDDGLCCRSDVDSRRGMEEGRKEMFCLPMHLTHFVYNYITSDIW